MLVNHMLQDFGCRHVVPTPPAAPPISPSISDGAIIGAATGAAAALGFLLAVVTCIVGQRRNRSRGQLKTKTPSKLADSNIGPWDGDTLVPNTAYKQHAVSNTQDSATLPPLKPSMKRMDAKQPAACKEAAGSRATNPVGSQCSPWEGQSVGTHTLVDSANGRRCYNGISADSQRSPWDPEGIPKVSSLLFVRSHCRLS